MSCHAARRGAAERAWTIPLDSGLVGPRPVRSMYFFRSVSRYSNTCAEGSERQISGAAHCAYQVQHGLAVLLHVLHGEEAARWAGVRCRENAQYSQPERGRVQTMHRCARQEQTASGAAAGDRRGQAAPGAPELSFWAFWPCEARRGGRAGRAAHRTTNTLLESIWRSETSRRAVEGTPSSSICTEHSQSPTGSRGAATR